MIVHRLNYNLNETYCKIKLNIVYLNGKEALPEGNPINKIKITENIDEVTCEKCNEKKDK